MRSKHLELAAFLAPSVPGLDFDDVLDSLLQVVVKIRFQPIKSSFGSVLVSELVFTSLIVLLQGFALVLKLHFETAVHTYVHGELTELPFFAANFRTVVRTISH